MMVGISMPCWETAHLDLAWSMRQDSCLGSTVVTLGWDAPGDYRFETLSGGFITGSQQSRCYRLSLMAFAQFWRGQTYATLANIISIFVLIETYWNILKHIETLKRRGDARHLWVITHDFLCTATVERLPTLPWQSTRRSLCFQYSTVCILKCIWTPYNSIHSLVYETFVAKPHPFR